MAVWSWNCCATEFYIVRFRTRNKMRVAIESGKGMKEKVVKLCWNKWNGPFFMHIYYKQCGIMQKNQWKGSNFQIQCFYNGTSGALCSKRQKTPKLEKLKCKLFKILKRYDLSRVVPCQRARPEHSKNVVVFRSARTSWNTFVRSSARPPARKI